MMLPFYVLILIPIAIQTFSVEGIDYYKKNKFAMKLFFFMLLCLMMLRHFSVGTDTETYMELFSDISNTPLSDSGGYSLEYGFVLLSKAISFVSLNPQVFLAITSLVCVAFIAPAYLRECEDTALTISLFCIMSTFVMLFSGIRQMIAISIGFLAYRFVRKKKILPYILSVVLAMTFHISAFMLFFMYPIYRVKVTKKWLWVIIPLLLALLVFNDLVFNALLVFLSRYTRFEAVEISATGAYTMVVLFSLFCVYSFLLPDEKSIDEETIGLRNFLLFSVVIQMFAPLHTLAMRMNYYYIIFIPLLIPKIIKHSKADLSNIAVLSRYCMVVFFVLYFLFTSTGGSGLDVFPYHFYWEKVSW